MKKFLIADKVESEVDKNREHSLAHESYNLRHTLLENYQFSKACKDNNIIAFKDDSIYLEKFFENPRHIKAQIFGDHYHNFIHLNITEYSIQRRNQKKIEEASTLVEFISKNNKPHFLEVNTSLQENIS
ncbi:MAG: hypothetical protein RMJ51_01105 [Candidatus Calescibacterium sp.]|nr:hypothetical protein [Candidatus Calescibacterium sp.]MCX7972142.1 hypothetical protein [bacterium]MDW8194831.1 hypothetical protein [Candidatus Calescibacterium sp.]